MCSKADLNTDGLNSFTLKLFRNTSAGKDENYFISSFSIVYVLSMVLSGARNKTENQLKSLLNLTNYNKQQIFDIQSSYLKTVSQFDSNVDLSLANKVYLNQGYVLSEEFKDNLAKYYESEAEPIDFRDAQHSAKTINDWIANKTNDKIRSLLNSDFFDDLTRLVLVNGIYFKGKWLHSFDKANTYKENFTLRDGSVKKVDMMKLLNKKFYFKINPGGLMACTCELPYIGENISMTIILPNEGINIEDVEKKITHDSLKEVLDPEKSYRPSKVHLYLPKFRLDLKTELSDTLKNLGASEAFNLNADFSGISEDSSGLQISKVVHQAVLEVNEEGTEAAAATAVAMMKRCAIMEDLPEEFRANRPFLFLIHDKIHHGILFFGKYMRPE